MRLFQKAEELAETAWNFKSLADSVSRYLGEEYEREQLADAIEAGLNDETWARRVRFRH